MILPTMTPKEKHAQMLRLKDAILGYTQTKTQNPDFFTRFRRVKVFPSFFTEEHEFPGMGKWTIIYEAESKSYIKKGVICIRAYQKFHVSYAKNPLNIGTGIYLMNADDYGSVQCQEFPPHYFNRLRERLIEPKGIVQPDFPQLVKAMLRLHHSSMDVVVNGFIMKKGEDGMYSLERDHKVDKKEGYDNLISYHRDGISLGVSAENKGYMNFTTFVPNSLLREGQVEMQQRMMKDIGEHELNQRYNPFATHDRREWMGMDEDF